jgi:hypothetical protein
MAKPSRSVSQSPINESRKGNLIECSGVRVVTVNWNQHSWLEQ